jgi:hypothetical protein
LSDLGFERTNGDPTLGGGNLPRVLTPFARSGFVSVDIFNLLGQKIESLFRGEVGSGSYSVQWDGSKWSGGVCFYQLKAHGFVETRRMLLVK